jgi:hypothetical protein
MSIVQVSVLPGLTMAAAPMDELLDERLAHRGRARRRLTPGVTSCLSSHDDLSDHHRQNQIACLAAFVH